VDTGRSRDAGGSGLGLAIVKHIMMRHGGVFDIASTLGEGSRFICRFPAARAVVRRLAKAGS
jgi:two-component system phosphate regulon sensor histidine kinase PhoR